jgi:hypothetical protein
MPRLHRQFIAWFLTVCLSLVAIWSPAQSLAMSLPEHSHPAAAAPCHGDEGEPMATHEHHAPAHGKTLCQNSCIACCPGLAAALPAHAAPLAPAGAASWRLPDGAPHLHARVADIFKPPRVPS